MRLELARHGRIGAGLVRGPHRLGDGQWQTVGVKVVMRVAPDQIQRQGGGAGDRSRQGAERATLGAVGGVILEMHKQYRGLWHRLVPYSAGRRVLDVDRKRLSESLLEHPAVYTLGEGKTYASP